MENTARSQSIRLILRYWLVVTALISNCLLGVFCYRTISFDNFGTFRRLTTVADVDSDGDLDVILVVTHWEGVATSFTGAVIWLNQGNGKFVLDEQRFGGFSTGMGDVDQDGDLDTVFALRNLVEIWHNNARGHFTPANQTFPFSRRHALAIGDFNADGRAEIFIAGETGYKVWFMPSP